MEKGSRMHRGFKSFKLKAMIIFGEHYSHVAYLGLVAIEGHGLYAKAAVVALGFVLLHKHLVERGK